MDSNLSEAGLKAKSKMLNDIRLAKEKFEIEKECYEAHPSYKLLRARDSVHYNQAIYDGLDDKLEKAIAKLQEEHAKVKEATYLRLQEAKAKLVIEEEHKPKSYMVAERRLLLLKQEFAAKYAAPKPAFVDEEELELKRLREAAIAEDQALKAAGGGTKKKAHK